MKFISSEIFWRAVLLICCVAAVLQNLLVAGRIVHIVTLMWKIDLESGVITAGSTMLVVFYGATIGCGLLAWMAYTKMPTGSIFRRISYGSILALSIGACVWGGIVCSPLVVYIHR